MPQCKYFIASFSLAIITCCALSQVIPASRSADWTLAGYHGTIPNYPVVKNITDYGGFADGVTANDLALQNAIESLTNQDGTIYFPAGTFLFNSPIRLRSGLVLKGEGATHTTLQFNLAGINNLITIAGNSSTTVAQITSSVLKDQSSLSVENASLFQVNDYVKIYQNDSTLVNDEWALESVGQVIHIKNISGNTIYFSNALRRNYLLKDAPKIRRLMMATGVGIECLKIKRIDSTGQQTSNIYFSNAAKCWVKGVESDSCNFAHVQIASSTNIEVTNCYFHGAFAFGAGGKGYGISCEYTSGECLIGNNIFKHLRHAMLLQSGANGNVFDYNYSLEPFKSDSLPGDLSGDIVLHGNYPYLNLFEGNIVQNIFADASHGINGPYNTMFRNRAESYGIIITQGAGDSTNIIGNEITGTGFGKGNYFLRGNGNLEYGNNKNDTIIPSVITTAPGKSYIYNSIPAFWNISSSWPPVGIPNILNAETIPAKERYIAGPDLTFCLATFPVIYTFSGNGNWNIASNWSNNTIPPALLSNGSEIIIDPPAGAKCVLNIPYTINPGVKFTVMTGKFFLVPGNLTLVK
ncbi:MAG: glycosyl hydrolase family 28-related protein [Ferruginibacter sp.]